MLIETAVSAYSMLSSNQTEKIFQCEWKFWCWMRWIWMGSLNNLHKLAVAHMFTNLRASGRAMSLSIVWRGWFKENICKIIIKCVCTNLISILAVDVQYIYDNYLGKVVLFSWNKVLFYIEQKLLYILNVTVFIILTFLLLILVFHTENKIKTGHIRWKIVQENVVINSNVQFNAQLLKKLELN